MAEYTTDNEEFCANSLAAYKEASDIALHLPPTHPIRLGLLLNFSVFFYEVLGEKSKALFMAEDGFEEAITLMDNLSDDNYKDTVLLMQLLRDNLTVWKAEFEEQKALDGKIVQEHS
jgi:14-3-3 protein epsilon